MLAFSSLQVFSREFTAAIGACATQLDPVPPWILHIVALHPHCRGQASRTAGGGAVEVHRPND